tara:strand:- start:54355 stop:55080 length:726 start_codon:yes stop_codon:yes gene_type:complete
MPQLALIRHGQSKWNLQNRFTGWVDIDLTADGEAQARHAGDLLAAADFKPDRAFSSVLTRAVRTLNFCLEGLQRVWIPVDKSWRLNERHYGALAGLDKDETRAIHGADQVKIWRRSFDIPPPPLAEGHPDHPSNDERYRDVPPALLPNSESLKMTLERVEPAWDGLIVPRLAAGENIIVAAHGNSLRALIKLLFNVNDLDIIDIEVPTGNPLLIDLDPETLAPVAARYLDADRAKPLPPLP